MRYLLAQGLVLRNLRWDLSGNLRWQWLDSIVGTSLDEPEGAHRKGEQDSQQLQRGMWPSHHLWGKTRTQMVKTGRPGDQSLLEKEKEAYVVFISRAS